MDDLLSHSLDKLSYVLVKENKLIDVGKKFLELIGYNKSKIINCDLEHVFNSVLKLNVNIEELPEDIECYIFNKNLEPIEVNIKTSYDYILNVKKYLISEIHNTNIKEKFKFIEQAIFSNNMSISIFSVPELTLLRASKSYIEMETKKNCVENYIGKNIYDITHGWDNSQLKKACDKAILEGKSIQLKEQKYLHNQKYLYLDIIINPIFEEDIIKYLTIQLIDVTEKVVDRKRIKEKSKALNENKNIVKQQLEKIDAIIENIPSGVFINYKDGKVLKLNEAARKELYKPDELKYLGDSYKNTEYFTIDGKELLLERTPSYRSLKGEKVKCERIIAKRPDKETILELSACPIYDDENNIIMSVTCAYDVTEIVRNEKIIFDQKEKMRSILENMPDSVFVFDNKRNFNLINKAEKNITLLLDLIRKEDSSNNANYYNMDEQKISIKQKLTEPILNGKSIKNYRFAAKTGERTLYFSVSGSPIYSIKTGQIIMGVICVRDITYQVNLEESFKKQQQQLLNIEYEKNEALKKTIRLKDNFLSTITHEFKTPITVINAALQTMDKIYGNQIPDKAKKHLQRIRINTLRQLRLVNNLLDITRYDAGRFKMNNKNIDIVFLTNAIINSVINYADEKCIILNFSSDVKSKIISIDDDKYERILLNLLSNAIKFTSQNKSIFIKLICNDDILTIEVKDEGIGIPKDKQNIIFERFGQVDNLLIRKAEGTGIGLSLVKSLVDGMGGSITVDSQIGSGSTFTVTLPIRKAKSQDLEDNTFKPEDNRIIKSVTLEFSDIYL